MHRSRDELGARHSPDLGSRFAGVEARDPSDEITRNGAPFALPCGRPIRRPLAGARVTLAPGCADFQDDARAFASKAVASGATAMHPRSAVLVVTQPERRRRASFHHRRASASRRTRARRCIRSSKRSGDGGDGPSDQPSDDPELAGSSSGAGQADARPSKLEPARSGP